MGQLGGKGDDPVVLLGLREGELGEAHVQKEGLQSLQQLHVGALVRGEDHGGPHIQVLGGGGKAAPLPAGHGVAADIGEAVLLGNGGQLLHHHPLDAAQVYQNGGRADLRGVLPYPVHRGLGPDGNEYQAALGQSLLVERAVDGPADSG